METLPKEKYEKVAQHYPQVQWDALEPLIEEILELKREKNAAILAHNYMTPDIFHGVADIVGDSLKLAQEAAKTKADVIVQAGVHFMAETSKILCMDKTILLPDMKAGCSLAESITAADVRLLKQQYPGVPIITYVNTSADVKAETDVCCTSGNVKRIIEALRDEGHKEIFCIPDKYLAQNVQNEVPDVNILTWERACEVHEKFTPEDIPRFRKTDPDAIVLAHPECPPEVMAEADLSGSTAQMINYVQEKQPKRVILITECSMGDNITAANPNVDFVRSCQLCPHMKRITLPKILTCLKDMKDEILVDADIAARAKKAVDRMLEYSA